MGRKSTLNEAALFRAVAAGFARDGQFTYSAIRTATGVSTGSLYHRFPSREVLLAECWLYVTRLFRDQFCRAIDSGSARGAIEAAMTTPRFCRAEPDLATMLFTFRRADCVGTGIPEQLLADINAAEADVESAVRAFAEAAALPELSCRLAMLAYPRGAVALFLPSPGVSVSLNSQIRHMVGAVLGGEATAKPDKRSTALPIPLIRQAA